MICSSGVVHLLFIHLSCLYCVWERMWTTSSAVEVRGVSRVSSPSTLIWGRISLSSAISLGKPDLLTCWLLVRSPASVFHLAKRMLVWYHVHLFTWVSAIRTRVARVEQQVLLLTGRSSRILLILLAVLNSVAMIKWQVLCGQRFSFLLGMYLEWGCGIVWRLNLALRKFIACWALRGTW